MSYKNDYELYLPKITQEEYIKLYDSGMLNGKQIDNTLNINEDLKNILTTNRIIKQFKYYPSNGPEQIYDNANYYVINRDRYCNRNSGEINYLKINFTCPYITIDELKENLQKLDVDNDFIVLVVNPRFYNRSYKGYEYDNFKNMCNEQYKALSIAHIAKKYVNHGKYETIAAIHSLYDYFYVQTGESLFFRF